MREREILKAAYRAVSWDKFCELAPGVSREQVDALFECLGEMLPGAPPAPEGERIASGSVRRVLLRCDGASRGNPGPAGIGVLLCAPDGKELEAWGAAIGRATSNVAEYSALLAGLTRALEVGIKEVEVLSDSELLVKQLTGAYRVKAPGLKELHARVQELLGRFDSWTARHVSREDNRRADKLASDAVRKQSPPRQ